MILKKRIAIGCVCLGISCSYLAAGSLEIFKAGFDKGEEGKNIQGWEMHKAERNRQLKFSSLTPASGKGCAQISYRGSDYLSWTTSPFFGVKPGSKIKVSFKYRNPAGVALFSYVAFFRKIGKAEKISTWEKGSKEKCKYLIRSNSAVKNDWTEYSSPEISIPSDVNFASISFGAGKNTKGIIYIDDLSIESDSKPEKNFLSDQGGKMLSAVKTASEKIKKGWDEKTWSKGIPVTGFKVLKKGTPLGDKTDLRIFYDDSNIYFAFKCYDSRLSAIVSGFHNRDDLAVCRNDSVEVLIVPDEENGKFYHFIANSSGSLYDSLSNDKSWNCEKVGVFNSKGDDYWTALISVPFSSIGIDKLPETGEKWKIKFMRTKMIPQKTLATYPFSAAGFSALNSLTDISFGAAGGEGDYFTISQASESVWGKNTLILDVNKDFKGEKLLVEILPADKAGQTISKSETCLKLTPGKKQKKELSYNIGSGREKLLVVKIMDENKKLLSTKIFKLSFPGSTQSLAELREKALQLKKASESLPRRTYRESIVKLASEIEDFVGDTTKILENTKDRKKLSMEKSNAISTKIEEFDSRIKLVSSYLGRIPAYSKITDTTTPLSLEIPSEIKMDMAVNEYKSFCLAFYNLLEASEVRIRVKHLRNSGNKTVFLSRRIDIRELKFIRAQSGRLIADPLTGNDANIFYIRKNLMTPVYFTLNSYDALPGIYEGEITIKPLVLSPDKRINEKNTKHIKLSVRVRNVVLPEELSVVTSMYSGSGGHSQCFDKDILLNDLRSHRMNALPSHFNEIVEGFENRISDNTQKQMYREGILKYKMQAFICPQYVKKYDLPPKSCFFFVSDEPKKIDEKLISAAKRFKSLNPEMRLVQNLGCVYPGNKKIDEFNKYVDIWMPHLTYIFPENSRTDRNLEFFRGLKKPVWTYQCFSEAITQDAMRDYKLYPWIGFKLGLEGLSYWAYASWKDDSWDAFDKVTFLSDTGLIYEGRFEGDIVSSIRWEAYREGLADYALIKYLIRLSEKTDSPEEMEKAKKLVDAAVSDVLKSARDSRLTDAWREKIFERIENLKKKYGEDKFKLVQ